MERGYRSEKGASRMEKAVFGASRFFSQKAFLTGFRGIEEVHFSRLKGIDLEVVEIWYNPWKVSYRELLELFFDLHDPTEESDQSFVYFANKYQYTAAKQKKKALEAALQTPLVTKIAPVSQLKTVYDKVKLIS